MIIVVNATTIIKSFAIESKKFIKIIIIIIFVYLFMHFYLHLMSKERAVFFIKRYFLSHIK